MNEIGKIQSMPSGTPEAGKPYDQKGPNAFSEVLNSVMSAAAKIQDETAKSIETIPSVGVQNIKVEMEKAGDAMNRIMQARQNLLNVYKAVNDSNDNQ
jgi:flagellar hook-basal body complex protein FliE